MMVVVRADFSFSFFFSGGNILCECLSLSNLPGSSRCISTQVFHNNLVFWLRFHFHDGILGNCLTHVEMSKLLVLPHLPVCSRLVKAAPLEPGNCSVSKYLLFVHGGMADRHDERWALEVNLEAEDVTGIPKSAGKGGYVGDSARVGWRRAHRSNIRMYKVCMPRVPGSRQFLSSSV